MNLDNPAGKQARHAKRGRFVSWQAAKFDGREFRLRSLVGAHHRIESLHQQRRTSNAAGFDESTTIHASDSIWNPQFAGFGSRNSRPDYDSDDVHYNRAKDSVVS